MNMPMNHNTFQFMLFLFFSHLT